MANLVPRKCLKCTCDFTVRWAASPQRFCSRLCAKEETYRKVSATQRGRPSPLRGIARPTHVVEALRQANLGRKCTEVTRAKMRAAKVGRPSPRRGLRHTEQARQKMSHSQTGRPSPRRGVPSNYFGSRHHNWRGGITPLNEQIRHSTEYRQWRIAVFERDDYTCQDCGARNGNGHRATLNADHIKPFSLFPELRLSLENGRTLCVPCHKKTPTYGAGSIKNRYELHGVA